MKWLANLRIGARLAIGFGACLFLTAALGMTALRGFSASLESVEAMSREAIPGLRHLGDVQRHALQFRTLQFLWAASATPREAAVTDRRMGQELEALARAFDGYERTITQTEDRGNFEELRKSWQGYLAIHERLKGALVRSEGRRRFDLVDAATTPWFLERVDPQLTKITAWNVAFGERAARAARARVESARRAVLLAVCLAALLGVAFGLAVTRSIVRPVGTLSRRLESLETHCASGLLEGLRAMERGDLTVTVTPATTPVESPGGDEIGHMCQTFNRVLAKTRSTVEVYEATRRSLSGIVGEVQQAAECVSAASEDLSAAASHTGRAAGDIARTIRDAAQASEHSAATSQEMARGSEQQARAATEAAASMERLAGIVAQVKEGGERARRAAEQADEGMRQAARAVEEVARSSQEMARAAQEAASVARNGGRAVQQTVEAMARIHQQMAVSAEAFARWTERGRPSG